MNENSISPKSNGAHDSENDQSKSIQVDISDVLGDLDTLRARIEHLENAFASEIGGNASRATRSFTFTTIAAKGVSKLKKWISNRRINSRPPQ